MSVLTQPVSRLACGLYDLDRLDKELFKRVLATRLDPRKVIEVTLGTQTIRAIPFRSDIPLTYAALALDVLRSENRKANQPEVSVYLDIDGTDEWKRIPDGEVLTVQLKGSSTIILNQRIFGTNPNDLIPPTIKQPARIGGRQIL